MAKLWFNYGAMGSCKSAVALMTVFNYKEKGLNPLLLQPKISNRDGDKIVKSRIGISEKCEYLEDYITNWKETKNKVKQFDAIIVDEVQFITVEQVDILWKIVKKLNIPVLCYGLDTDFKLNYFSASERLKQLHKKYPKKCKMKRLRTVCWCGKGAICNTRIHNGKIIKSGKQIELGANDKYISLCKKHYKLEQLGN